MASGYNKWVSPRQAPSPKRKRVQELRDKFEALSDKSTGKGSGKESSQGYSRGRGSGTAHQGSGSGYGQTSGPSSEYSDSLRDQSDEPSFSKVLESTRLDGREGQQLSGDVEPTGMEPEGFQYPAARQKDPEPSRGATGGFRYPDYGTPKLPPQKADESSKYESMDYVKWYVDNVDKVSDFDMLCFEICLLLRDHVPGIKVDGDYSADLIVMMLKTFVKELLSKFRKFDLDLAEIEGFEMADKIHDHKRKVLDVIDELEDKLEDSKEEVATVKRQLGEVYAALLAAEETIEHLKASQERECAAGNDKQFMEKLQMSISDSVFEHYEQEIEHLKHDNKKLRQQLRKSTRQTVETEEQCMQDLSDASQRSDLNSKLKEALMSMLDESEEKQPNRKDAMKVVSKWYDHIKSAMRENEEMIDDLWQRYESSTKDRAHLAGKCDALEEEMEQLKSHINKNKQTITSYQEQKQRLLTDIEKITNLIAQMEEQKERDLSFLGAEGQNISAISGSSRGTNDSESLGGSHSPESSGGMQSPVSSEQPSPEKSGGKHSPESSEGKHSPESSEEKNSPESPVSSEQPSPEKSGRKHSPESSGGKHSPESSGEIHSPKTTDKMLSTESSDTKHDSVGGKSPNRPGNQPIRKNISRSKRGYSTSIIGKKSPPKPYFPSQGSGFGSDFEFEYPSPGYFGFSDSGRFDYADEDYTPDSEALIQEKYYLDGHLTPLPDDSIEDDSVFLPDDPEADRSMRKFFKQLKYRHILPTFSSDEGSVDDYKFRAINTDPPFIELMDHNFKYPEWHPYHIDAFHMQNPRMGQYHNYPSPGGRKSFDSPHIAKPHPASPQFGIPTPRIAQSASPGGKKSYDSPYIPKPHFASQSEYRDDDSFVFSQGSPLNKTVTINSPGRDEPLKLNIKVQPKNITESASGEHVICDIALDMQEAPRPIYEQESEKKIRRRGGKKNFGWRTPPVTPSQARDPRKGTPTSVFKKRHYGIRNLFDAQKDASEYKSPSKDSTIEWEIPPKRTYDYYRQAPQTAWQNFSLTPTNAPEEQETSSRWKEQARLDAPETSAQWKRPGQFGGASPPEELSQTFPYRERPDTPPSPRTV